ncbi:MAG: helix-turn-helix domain-containing protein, partial [Planctomycetia bacterium]
MPSKLDGLGMSEYVTPKQVAKAIGVSESSLKRWCDKGLLVFSRTAGGHRRVHRSAAIRFLRETSQTLVEPEILGLPPRTGQNAGGAGQVVDLMAAALCNGDVEQFRRLVFDLYLANQSLVDLCDRIITPAF